MSWVQVPKGSVRGDMKCVLPEQLLYFSESCSVDCIVENILRPQNKKSQCSRTVAESDVGEPFCIK